MSIERQSSMEAPSGGEDENATTRKPGAIPATLIVVGLIVVLGSYMVLNHLLAIAWDSDPLHWEIVTDIVLVGVLITVVGLLVGALDDNVDSLVRLGMVLGAAVMISLVVYEALTLFSIFQLG